MTYRYGETSQHDCLYNTARRYPGGVEALATRLVIRPKILGNKLRPTFDTNQMSFEEATAAMEFCAGAGVEDPHSALHAMAFRLGFVCVPIPSEDDDLSQEAIALLGVKLAAQVGEALNASTQAMSDDVLSEREFDEIQPKMRKIHRFVAGLMAKLNQRVSRDRIKQAA